MYIRAAILALILAALACSAAWRGVLAPAAWWNWLALATALAALALVVVDLGRQRARLLKGMAEKPRWYHFRLSGISIASIVLLLAWWLARVPAPMGSGPAGATVNAARFEQRWLKQPVALVSLGDSVSTGYGAGKGMGYFDLIQHNADDAYPDMRGLELNRVLDIRHVERLAVNSTSSIEHEGVIRRMQVWPADTFGLVCMTTGGIDLIQQYGKARPREGAMYGADWATVSPGYAVLSNDWIACLKHSKGSSPAAVRSFWPRFTTPRTPWAT